MVRHGKIIETQSGGSEACRVVQDALHPSLVAEQSFGVIQQVPMHAESFARETQDMDAQMLIVC